MFNDTSRFDRITPQRADKPGQAFIRDTNITVSEVVKLVVGGKRVDEVLAQYDDLEIEDVHQALAFSVDDLRHTVDRWVHERYRFLTIPLQYATLLDNQSGILESATNNDKVKHQIQKELVKTTLWVLPEEKRGWHHLANWVNLNYSHLGSSEPQKMSISEFEETLAQNLVEYPAIPPIELDIENNLPDFLAPKQLVYLILNLTSNEVAFRYIVESSKLKIVQKDEKHLLFLLKCQLKDTITNFEAIDIFEPAIPHSISALILREHGCDLQTEITDHGVTFSLELPIWKDD